MTKTNVIGHVDSGKTNLAHTIFKELKKERKTINEIIEDQNTIQFNAPKIVELTPCVFKSGQESRRERRKKERKKWKKT